MLELCDRLGAGVLVHHCGSAQLAPGENAGDLDQMEREALHEMAEVAKGYGARIVLENIFTTTPGQYRQTPSEVAATVRAVGHSHLAALIDFSHAYIESSFKGLDFRQELRAMAEVAGHLHVHDSFGLPYTMKTFYHPAEATALGIGDLHLPLGWGDIAWEDIFSELTFLPDTTLIMEIDSGRFAAEQPACLERARKLADLVNTRAQAACRSDLSGPAPNWVGRDQRSMGQSVATRARPMARLKRRRRLGSARNWRRPIPKPVQIVAVGMPTIRKAIVITRIDRKGASALT